MRRILIAALLALGSPSLAEAHFGLVVPSDPMVAPEDPRAVTLTLAFTHPFEGEGMDLVRPRRLFAKSPEQAEQDLLPTLKPLLVNGRAGFTAELALERPGSHVIAMEPEPYWEPAEDSFIQHFTKTYVASLGDDSGWDQVLGLRTEIAPLTRPFGLYAGNLFQGVVLKDGQPQAGVPVEIEYWNADPGKPVAAPDPLMITQTVLTDSQGVFSYAAPGPGWWGFAALTTAEETLPHEGVAKPVELGAVLWVRFEPWGGAR